MRSSLLAVALALLAAPALASPRVSDPVPRSQSFTILGFKFCVVEVGYPSACTEKVKLATPSRTSWFEPVRREVERTGEIIQARARESSPTWR